MYDLAPTHLLGLIGGLVAIPIAIVAVRKSPWHRTAPATVQIAAVLMAVSGAVHLALIPHHLQTSPFTSVLFLANGLAFIALAAFVRWRWWRFESALLIVLTLIGYAVYIGARLEIPDQVGIATKLVELAALGMVLVPVRADGVRRHRTFRWSLLGAGLPILLVLVTSVAWITDLAHPNATHSHAGALLQRTNLVPTAEQQAAATELYDQTAAAIEPYKDSHNAWLAGYRPNGSTTMPSTHWINDAYVKAGYVMDPQHPQGLVYANSHHGPVLLGAMFEMKNIGVFGPDPGGPLTAWHQHQNICFTPFGLEFSLMTPFSTCPLGAIDFSAPAMLHVWIVPNPQGGPFAVDIDPKVVAALDRT
ncbi:MAG TPA: hypothetical protein VJT78_12580 [Candidatus Dormibacteraeota bacterium]|nr:hypothetical protein [Candidatus Dormibacteraeota bacterium]